MRHVKSLTVLRRKPLTPSSRSNKRWVDRQRERRQSRFFRLLDRSFRFRLFMATLAACSLLVMVNRWENCRHRAFAQGCLLSDQGGIINVGNVEALSIVTAALLFVLEGDKRHQREHLEAMEVLLATQQAGAKLSFARNTALEMLNDAGLPLDGFNLCNTNLDGLRVPGCRWRGVNLQGSSLQNADLRNADLEGADLQGADLSGSNLNGANLKDVKLKNTNLKNTNLKDANLAGTILLGDNP